MDVTGYPLFAVIFKYSVRLQCELVSNDVDLEDMSALWRGMPVTSPPVADLRMAHYPRIGPMDVVFVHNSTGVRLGDVAAYLRKNDRIVPESETSWQPAYAKGADERRFNVILPRPDVSQMQRACKERWNVLNAEKQQN